MADNSDGKSDTAKSFEKAHTLKPSSKLEKDALERQRGVPTLQHVPTPDGGVVRQVHAELSADKEARINEIEASLKRAREQKGMKRNFDRKK